MAEPPVSGVQPCNAMSADPLRDPPPPRHRRGRWRRLHRRRRPHLPGPVGGMGAPTWPTTTTTAVTPTPTTAAATTRTPPSAVTATAPSAATHTATPAARAALTTTTRVPRGPPARARAASASPQTRPICTHSLCAACGASRSGGVRSGPTASPVGQLRGGGSSWTEWTAERVMLDSNGTPLRLRRLRRKHSWSGRVLPRGQSTRAVAGRVGHSRHRMAVGVVQAVLTRSMRGGGTSSSPSYATRRLPRGTTAPAVAAAVLSAESSAALPVSGTTTVPRCTRMLRPTTRGTHRRHEPPPPPAHRGAGRLARAPRRRVRTPTVVADRRW